MVECFVEVEFLVELRVESQSTRDSAFEYVTIYQIGEVKKKMWIGLDLVRYDVM